MYYVYALQHWKIIEVSLDQANEDTSPILQISIDGQTYTFPYSLNWDKSEHTLNVKLDKEHSAVSLILIRIPWR